MRLQVKDEQVRNDSMIIALEDWEEVVVCEPCLFDPASGRYEHNNSGCPTHHHFNIECPYEIADRLNDRQQRLNTLDLLTDCFRKPEIAIGQRTLEGFAMDESFVYLCEYDFTCICGERKGADII
jgi:hypothetical protein